VPELRQVWFYVATGTSLYPDTKVVYDTRLGRYHGKLWGATRMVRAYGRVSESLLLWPVLSLRLESRWAVKLKPYIGYTGGTAIWNATRPIG
jgi:hypothetical protein